VERDCVCSRHPVVPLGVASSGGLGTGCREWVEGAYGDTRYALGSIPIDPYYVRVRTGVSTRHSHGVGNPEHPYLRSEGELGNARDALSFPGGGPQSFVWLRNRLPNFSRPGEGNGEIWRESEMSGS
jgi:hypothetical protein